LIAIFDEKSNDLRPKSAVSVVPAAFTRLACSNLGAQSAEQIALAAAPVFAVLALGAGVGETGLLQAAQTLPFLLLSSLGGVLADRMPRCRLMAGAEALRASALIAVPLFAALDVLSVPLLALLGFIGATGTVVYSVAAPSLVQSLVPRELLTKANGRLELARSSAFAAGPALAGVLVAWGGASCAFLFAAVLSIYAALALAGMQEPSIPAAPARHFIEDLHEGATFVWTHPLLRPILLTAVVFNFSWFVLQAAYVPYATAVLQLSAAGIGATLSAYGIGMVVGAAFASRLARWLPFGFVIGLGPLAAFVAASVMVLTIQVPSALLAGLAFFLFGVGPALWTVGQTTLRQAVTPAHLLGRVSAVIMTATFGTRPLGAAIGGFVGALSGPTPCIILAAGGFLLQLLVIHGSRVPRLRTVPGPPPARMEEVRLT
jgi:predicted MFS family arabinose efflux permease